MEQMEYQYRECFIISNIMNLPTCRNWLQWVVLNPDLDLIDYQIIGGLHQCQVMIRVSTTEEFFMLHPDLFQYNQQSG